MSDIGYPIVVTALSDEEGGGFIASVPDLKGCMGDGATPDEAVRDVVSAMGEWIDEARRLGRDVPEPGSVFKQAREEHQQLHDLLRKQRDLIKRQARLLAQAREEVERVQAATESILDLEPMVSCYGEWLVSARGAGSNTILHVRSQRPAKARVTN